MLQVARNGGGAIALLRNDTSVSSGNELAQSVGMGMIQQRQHTKSAQQKCLRMVIMQIMTSQPA